MTHSYRFTYRTRQAPSATFRRRCRMTVIRTPHGLLDLRALAAWNLRNARSRAEYAAHEFAGHTDRYLKTCDHCTAAKENR